MGPAKSKGPLYVIDFSVKWDVLCNLVRRVRSPWNRKKAVCLEVGEQGGEGTCDEGEEGSSGAKGNHGRVLGEEHDRVFFRSDSGFCMENRSVKAEKGNGREVRRAVSGER